MLTLSSGDDAAGHELMAAALAIYRRNDDGPGLECMGLNLGSIALDAGDPERALWLLEESVPLSRQLDLDRNLPRGYAADVDRDVRIVAAKPSDEWQ